MLPEIWSATDIIFVHFGLCFALLPHYWHRKLKFEKNVKNTLNEDHMMYQKSWSYHICYTVPDIPEIGLLFCHSPNPLLPSFLPYRPNQFQGPENGQKITENCHFIFCIFAKDEILLSQILHCRKQTWRAFAEYFRNFPYFTH